MKKRSLALVLALTLLIVSLVSGTLAWLTAKSDTVVNTFTTSGIQVELKETTGRDYKMIPGYDISKDPKATVLAGSEECYLFVKLDKSAKFDDYLTYEMAGGWELVDGQTNVYSRKVLTADIGKEFPVLKDNKVSVKGEVTKDMMTAAETTKPTLTVTAYASQLHKNATEDFTAAQAWDNIG